MTFQPGDRVHLRGIGTGEFRERRRGGRCVVLIKNMPMVVAEDQLEAVVEKRPPRTAAPSPRQDEAAPRRTATIDLHGKTAAETTAILDEFISDALLDGVAEARIIHGRSGGRVKSAVHACLRRIAAVRGFRIDPANPGVTIVTF